MSNTSTPFQVYNASAGSGKTFTIVKKYLSILLKAKRKDYYKNILAITFTNKAVGEMKTRIVDSLRDFAEQETPPNSQPLLEEVKKETNLSTEEIKGGARLILKSILHNYAAFDVSTIDGFTHRVLRTFAKDLGLPMNFEVELNTLDILTEAVDKLISKAGTDKKLTKVLIDFAISKADDDKSWDIAKDLYDIAKLLVNENNIIPLNELQHKEIEDFQAFDKELRAKIQSSEEVLKQTADTFFNLLQQNGLEDKDYNRASIPKYFRKIEILNYDVKKDSKKAKWELEIDSASHYAKKQTDDKKSAMDAIQPQVANLYFTSEETINKIAFYNSILKKLTSLSLLNLINKEVEVIKTEKNLLLISEFNRKISESIKEQPAPFIYERLGERYQDFFIDEFQDTSELQWNNLIPLIENNLSTQDFSGNHKGQLFVVGDAKQSIYRWRGGKSEQFIDLSETHNPFNVEKQTINLPKNFRSKQEIVNFNNGLFNYCAEKLTWDKYQTLFKNAYQEPHHEKGGFVNISFVEAINNEEREEAYPEKVLETIKHVTSNGYTKKDICILVRKKAHGYAVANYLNENGIPIISTESLLVKNSEEVNFINAIFRYSLNPSDKNIKFEILDYLFKNQIETQQYFTEIHPRLTLIDNAFFESLHEYYYFFDLSTLQRLPLYDAAEYIIRSFALDKKADAYLQFYLDFLYEYTQKNTGIIAGFIDYWEQKKDNLSIIAPEGEDAVQIMTIHTSKGLEFPIVIYPYVNESLEDTRNDDIWVPLLEEPNQIPYAYLSASSNLDSYGEIPSALYQKLLIENEFDALNILYVALTRPKQQLYIISEVNPKKPEEEKNDFPGLLKGYLKSINKWEKEMYSYNFGNFVVKEQKEVIIEVERMQFTSSAPTDHNISLITKSGLMWDSEQQEAIDIGNLIHNLLMNIYTEKDIQKALDKSINNGELTAEDAAEYKAKVEEIVNHSALKPYFSSAYQIYNEKEIITPNGFKRIDRLCLKDNTAIIIDYKTGSESTSHHQQLNEYAQYVTEIGYQVKQKILVYLYPSVTVKIL
ncbi:ATP-dependent exoDNAse (exonuclease V) beta subunit (contains helicase and exonuclease domains) [Mesonia phycicola]|uniref:DNA 3'-5' helicase n=1 Tax=Mesonia phycicola TaxID=579105 RepID=A0A1M6CXD0_9FLAO|nr:UvrD-helicase domain-containing protein [Mesonia phycicola]SHI65735.1 ATP-dependent exoDNAse (exonuclease V) beta subunit (contains helicase and exonuclease domains) [Mesonia phycicola]